MLCARGLTIFDALHASYLIVPLCPGRTICQKPGRNLARMGLWGTWISGKVRGLRVPLGAGGCTDLGSNPVGGTSPLNPRTRGNCASSTGTTGNRARQDALCPCCKIPFRCDCLIVLGLKHISQVSCTRQLCSTCEGLGFRV